MSPVVLVDHFVMTGPAFGPHSHAGISAATLMLEDSTGAMQSLDGIEHNREIRAGDLHWTLAGRGIVHAQRPAGEARLHGLQIFFDLPGRLKTLPATTALLRAEDMPVIQTHSGRIRVVSGSFAEQESPLQTPEPLLILDGWLRPGATTLIPLRAGWNAWITTVQGELGVRARHRCRGAVPLPKVAGGDADFAVVSAGSAVAANATACGEEGVLLLMAGCAPAHFVLIAGPAVDVPAADRGAASGDVSLAQALAAYGNADTESEEEEEAQTEGAAA